MKEERSDEFAGAIFDSMNRIFNSYGVYFHLDKDFHVKEYNTVKIIIEAAMERGRIESLQQMRT